ncbi:MAG: tetratricopeptide repeat protein [Acidobacteria bacterium]|nr:tetratricopeptide repeat protein [Acidobacteriota bacterium]
MRSRTFTRLGLAVLALSLCAAAQAQDNGSLPDAGDTLGTGGRHMIEGRVYLPSGRKLDRRLRVRLSGVRGGENSTLTDDNGAFAFRRLSAGTYTVTVEGGNEFETASENVDVFDGPRRTDQPGQVYSVQLRLEEKRAAAEPKRAGVVSAAPDALAAEVRAHNEKALEASAAGDHKRALKELEAAVKLAPDQPVLRINYGILLIRQKKYKEAEEQLARAVALDDKNAAARVHHGHALIRLNRGAEAETELLAAVKLGGTSVALAHRYLGALYVERGDDARAAAALEQYLRLAPDAADAAQVRGVLSGLKPQKKN